MYYTAIGRSPKHTAKGAPLDEGHAVLRPVITLPEEVRGRWFQEAIG
jgi:hypothetical protein